MLELLKAYLVLIIKDQKLSTRVQGFIRRLWPEQSLDQILHSSDQYLYNGSIDQLYYGTQPPNNWDQRSAEVEMLNSCHLDVTIVSRRSLTEMIKFTDKNCPLDPNVKYQKSNRCRTIEKNGTEPIWSLLLKWSPFQKITWSILNTVQL